jgi:hypothetical protein
VHFFDQKFHYVIRSRQKERAAARSVIPNPYKSRSRYATNGYVSEPIRLSNIATKAHKKIIARRRCSQMYKYVCILREIWYTIADFDYDITTTCQKGAPPLITLYSNVSFDRDVCYLLFSPRLLACQTLLRTPTKRL